MNVQNKLRLKVMTMREEKGYSQSDLGSAIGISRSHMNKLENGTLQFSIVYLKQIADVLGVSLDTFFEDESAKKEMTVFDFAGVNQALMELACAYLEAGENYFTVPYSALLVTEEKLDQWKENAQAGSLIIGSVGCRYLIISDSKPDPKNPGRLLAKYAFVNIDHANWELCTPRFDSSDELIEWFASNIENPIVDVISSRSFEKTTPGQDYI